MEATYVSANTFTVDGDKALEFNGGRRVKATLTAGDVYCTVSGSTYSAGTDKTTVTLHQSELDGTLSAVLYGVVSPGVYGSLPDHAHDGAEGSGGTISGTGGTSDHSALGNLDYASSGHTGFASSADLSTFSGTSVHVDGDATVTGTMYAHIYDSYSPLTIKDGGVTVIAGDGTGNIDFPAGATVSGSPLQDGQDGVDGTGWYSGSGVPTSIIGSINDFYYDENTGDVYKKDGVGLSDLLSTGGSASAGTDAIYDGNTETYFQWTGGYNVRTSTYDFGSGVYHAINYIKVYDARDPYYIFGSVDGGDWDLLVTSAAHSYSWANHSFSNNTAYRYIRYSTQYAEISSFLAEMQCYISDATIWQLNSNIKGADGNDAPTTFSGLSDTPPSYDDGKYLRSTASGTEWAVISGAGEEISFLDLTDTPTTYSGAEGRYLRATVSGTEWATVSGGTGASSFIDLTDTPSTYAGGTFQFTDTNTKFLLQSDTTNNSTDFEDISASAHTITRHGDTKHSTTEKKIGTTAIYFDGTGDYLTTSDSTGWDFETAAFCIEYWINPSKVGVYYFGWYNGEAWFEYSRLSIINYIAASDSKLHARIGGPDIELLSTSTISTSSWTHVAVTREGNSFRLFINGIQEATASNSAAVNNLSEGLWLGRFNISAFVESEALQGYLDEIRIVKGDAVYTANFTPPTTHFSVGDYSGPYERTQFLTTNSNSTALEFQTLPNRFTDLTDTPTTCSGTSGQYLVSTGSGTEFSGGPSMVESTFKAYELVQEWTPSSSILNVSVSGVAGDTNDIWLVEYHGQMGSGGGGQIAVQFNNDTTTNYHYGWFGEHNDSMEASWGESGYTWIPLNNASASDPFAGTAKMYLKSGKRRLISSENVTSNNTDDDYHGLNYFGSWDNTSSEVTTIRLQSSVAFTGTVRLYKFKKVSLPSVETEANLYRGKQSIKVQYATASGINCLPGNVEIGGTLYNISSTINKSTSSLTASTWYYVYIDPPSVGISLAAADIEYSTTAPTQNATLMGQYNGSKRCIGAFYSDSSSNIDIFHSRGRQIIYDTYVNVSLGDISTWTTVTNRVPLWSDGIGKFTFWAQGATSTTTAVVRVRPYGASSNGISVGFIRAGEDVEFAEAMDYLYDTSGRFEYDTGGNDASVDTNGYILPDDIYTGV